MSKEDAKLIVGNIDRVAWIREKNANQLYHMASVIEKLNNFLTDKNLSFSDIDEYFEYDLALMSQNSTKVTLALHGYPRSFVPSDTVYSVETLRILHENYNLSSGNNLGDSQKLIREKNINIFKKIIDNLVPNKIEHKEEVYNLCQKIKLDNSVSNLLKTELEEVYHGNLPWHKFCTTQKNNLAGFLETY